MEIIQENLTKTVLYKGMNLVVPANAEFVWMDGDLRLWSGNDEPTFIASQGLESEDYWDYLGVSDRVGSVESPDFDSEESLEYVGDQ